mmetsp:Transcript_17431/g.16626  ORF Transcript_17431/g.16626 Transcript_17431/m.16626 type:complete len:120 (-) Transcript_17431:40-399(-)
MSEKDNEVYNDIDEKEDSMQVDPVQRAELDRQNDEYNRERVPMPESWSEETKDRYIKMLRHLRHKIFKWEHVSLKKLKDIEKKHGWVESLENEVSEVEHDLEKVAKKAKNKMKDWFGGN